MGAFSELVVFLECFLTFTTFSSLSPYLTSTSFSYFFISRFISLFLGSFLISTFLPYLCFSLLLLIFPPENLFICCFYDTLSFVVILFILLSLSFLLFILLSLQTYAKRRGCSKNSPTCNTYANAK
jgi:hypothetical protein